MTKVARQFNCSNLNGEQLPPGGPNKLVITLRSLPLLCPSPALRRAFLRFFVVARLQNCTIVRRAFSRIFQRLKVNLMREEYI